MNLSYKRAEGELLNLVHNVISLRDFLLEDQQKWDFGIDSSAP
jgi:hypothetical protein